MTTPRPAPFLVSLPPVRVSDRGVYLVPRVAQEARFTRICAQVVVERQNKSTNLKPLEPKSFYGYAQIFTNGYVSELTEINYGKQQLFLYDNVEAQLQMQIHCSTENLNTNLAIAYTGLASPIPPVLFPGYVQIPLQPPFLPRCPWDEVWIKVEGGATVAIWAEYMPLDFLCDSARERFAPPESDRGQDKNLPNPAGTGNQGQPGGGQDVSGIPSAPSDGNGQGDDSPFILPGTIWRIRLFGSGQNAFCESFSGLFNTYGPYTAKPTIDFPKDGNKGDGANRCGFADERHVRIVINGQDQGGSNALGLTLNPQIERQNGGVGPWVPA